MPTNFLTSLVSSWEFSEASGDALDDVGTNPLTVTGATQNVSDMFGKCVSLDGINDKLTIADATQVGLDAGTGSFSWETWIKLTDAQGAFVSGKRGGGGGNDKGYQLDQLGAAPGTNTLRAYISDGTNVANRVGTTVFSLATLYQAVVVVDRTAQLLHLYLNATEEGTGVNTSAVGSVSNSDAFAIGVYNALSAGWLNGKVDRVRVWIGRALSASEVTELYAGGAGIAYADLGGAATLRNLCLLGVGS